MKWKQFIMNNVMNIDIGLSFSITIVVDNLIIFLAYKQETPAVVGVMWYKMWYYSILLSLGLIGHIFSKIPEFSHIQEGVQKRDVENQCITPVCETATSKMLFSMDHSADPCEDFHEFVCGNHNNDFESYSIENLQVIDKYLRNNVRDQSKKYLLDFREFYGSCVDFDISFNFIENMKLIKKYTSTNLTGVFTELILTQSMPFFDVGININKEDASYVFQINLPGRSSLKTEVKDWNVFHQVEKECEEYLDNSIVTESVVMENVQKDFEECRENRIMKYAEKYLKDMKFALHQEQIIDYKSLQDILKEQLASLKVADDSNKITELTINKLSQTYGRIDWKLFFEGLANKTFTGDEIIEVHNPDYLKKSFEFMDNFDEKRLVEILQEFSSFQLYKNFFRIHEYKKQFCMDLAQELMPDIATMIQYEVKNSSSTKEHRCQTLFKDLKETLRSSLQNSSMENEMKQSFITKLNELELGLITSGDSYTTENNYKNVIVTKNNYTENVLNLLKNYKKMLFSLVHTRSSAATLLTYFVSPLSTSPKTFYASNFIVLHTALFDRVPVDYPENIYVAKLGLLLAQEIAKHFDLIGRSFRTDAHSTDEYYDVIKSDAINVLDNYHLISPLRFHGTLFDFMQLDASDFTNEMVAGNTAFRLVHYYLETQGRQDIQLPWISDNIYNDQIIFIAAAQEFCEKYSKALFVRNLHDKKRLPFSLKIQIMMSSSPSFSEAFECSDGSTMGLDTLSMVHFPYYQFDDYDDSFRITDSK